MFEHRTEEINVSLTLNEYHILTELADKLVGHAYDSDDLSELVGKAIRVYSEMIEFVHLK